MMAGKGGYQAPANPAPVSGPGALSQRTDGGPGAMQGAKYVSGLPYGEGQEFMEMQQMAPMEAAPKTPSAAGAARDVERAVAAEPQSLVPLSAPSSMPNVPVTDGAAFGPGRGEEALNPQQVDMYELASSLRPLLQYDTTGDIRFLYNIAVSRGW